MAAGWQALTERAREVQSSAYAPYSGFPVGAAAEVDDGRIVAACNVENASHGLGLCAECGLVSALHATGGGSLVRVVVVGPQGQPLVPCGRCRQLLHEHGGADCLVLTEHGPTAVGDLLPAAFGPQHLSGEQR